ncbi:MAG: D-2-hydroxyacid dehydrogenase [Blastocatellia bacterium]
MSENTYTIWTNASFSEELTARLIAGVAPHRLVFAEKLSAANLATSPDDLQLAAADIAFGQPDPAQLMRLPNLRWAHLSTAGYTNYDNDDMRAALRARGAALTTSSGVYDEPCAQHALAMMMALARQLPQSHETQRTDHAWYWGLRRRESYLLNGQTAILLGFGAIALRLCELLAPFRMNLIGVRRAAHGNEPIKIITEAGLDAYLPLADHIVNILPANAATTRYLDARKLSLMKPGVLFYNIGRGTTVDQEALLAALHSGHIGTAYLDVTDPEPLPVDHPLWTAPRCYITPHTAGGQREEYADMIDRFLDNLRSFTAGEPLAHRVI